MPHDTVAAVTSTTARERRLVGGSPEGMVGGLALALAAVVLVRTLAPAFARLGA